MPIITEDDLIQSIADAFQFISYFHPPDFIRAMSAAWEKEENPSAKQAMSQILVNSRMCDRASPNLSGYGIGQYSHQIRDAGADEFQTFVTGNL